MESVIVYFKLTVNPYCGLEVGRSQKLTHNHKCRVRNHLLFFYFFIFFCILFIFFFFPFIFLVIIVKMVLCSSCTTSILVTQKRIKCSSTNCSNQYHQECIKLNDTVNVPRGKSTCPTCKRSPKDSQIPSNASPGTSTANMNSFQDMILLKSA